jgi:tetratricopeptide (TPR) repeat protein
VAIHSFACHARGYVHFRAGRWREARDDYQFAINLWRPTENKIAALFTLGFGAEAYLACQQVEQAQVLLTEALELTENAGALHFGGIAERIQGQLFDRLGKLDEASSAFAVAETRLEALGSRLELGRVLYHRAAMWWGYNKKEDAMHDTAQALEIFEEVGAARDIEETRALLAG